MNLFSLSWRNLRAQKVRTLATLVGVGLAVASFVALVGLARGVEQSLLSALELRGTDVVVTEAGAGDLLSSIVSADLAEEIANIPGVEATAAELTRVTSLDDGRSAIVVAWPDGAFPWQTLDVVAGQLPYYADVPTAVIGEGLAERYQLAMGETLQLFQSEFRIVGIVGSRSALTRNLILVLLPDAQRLTYRDGQATSINARLDPDTTAEDRQQTIDRLRTAFPAYSVDETEKLASNYTFARIADVLSSTISLVAMVSAIFAIFNTMSMAVNERRGEIAIMGAVGWPRRRIVACVVIEGMLLTVVAGLLGSAAGAAAAHSVSRFPTITGFIHPEISSGLMVQAILVSMLIGLLGSLVPALRTVSLSPASVLRGR
jgi:putative ABC transport system permease protein